MPALELSISKLLKKKKRERERERGHKSRKAALMTSATLDTPDSMYLLFSFLKGKAH